jgi:hypothetical protein
MRRTVMFKRRHTEPDEPVSGPLPTASAPDTPVVLAPPAPPEAAEPRTTCYPQDADTAPPIVGQPRTTVYRQGLPWNRGGYETVN